MGTNPLPVNVQNVVNLDLFEKRWYVLTAANPNRKNAIAVV
jgi:hypothetical protein